MRRLGVLLVSLVLPGCTSIGYYAQAVSGHLEVMWLAQPIEKRIQDPAMPEALRVKLAKVLAIREFASRELALPQNGSYRRYAEIGRSFVLWNVFAAPEFSLDPVQSCFVFAGCVSYRGYYSENSARTAAAAYADRGYDVYVGGVPAYSTLGWFDDPVLSTFINYPEPELARLLFHELAHQEVYVKDDTAFNESFATMVEEEGVQRWLRQEGTSAQRMSYSVSRQRRTELIALFDRYRSSLSTFYARALPQEEKRAGKRRMLAQMLDDYHALRASWSGFSGYDRLFADGVNNALLASVASYTQWVPAFRALLAQKHDDLAAFYAAVRELGKLGKTERTERLARLGAS
jgi:predicted aminopeptidase